MLCLPGCLFNKQIKIFQKQSRTKAVTGCAHKMCRYSRDPWRRAPTQHLPLLYSFALFNFPSSLFNLPTRKKKCRKHTSLDAVWVQVFFLCKTFLEEIIFPGNYNVRLLAHGYILQFGSKYSFRLESPVANLDVSESAEAQWNCTAHLAYV